MAMVTNHIHKLKSQKEYEHAYIYVFIESNLSHLSADMVGEMLLKQFTKVVVVSEDSSPDKRYGVLTTNPVKKNMADGLLRVMIDPLLCFATNVISEDLARNRKNLVDQLGVYRKEVELPKTAFGRIKETYTGKSPGRQDDLAIVTQMATYWGACQRMKPDFIAFGKLSGWLICNFDRQTVAA
jgi:hypothetical protein